MFEFDFPTGTAVLDYMFVDQDPRLGYGGAVARARRCSRETGDFTDLAVMLDKAKAQRIAAWAAVRRCSSLNRGKRQSPGLDRGHRVSAALAMPSQWRKQAEIDGCV